MFDTALRDPGALPEPGEVWRHRTGQHYVVTQRSVHGETEEVLVVCRSSTAPHKSVAFPLDHFVSGAAAEDRAPRFERVEELVS
jgi:hypothetical protein